MADRLDPGRLDRRITIESATETRDAAGGSTLTWGAVDTVWAERRDLRGRELFAAQQVTPEAQAVFRIRWRADLLPAMRIVDGAQAFEIVGHPAELGKRDGLEIVAKAVG